MTRMLAPLVGRTLRETAGYALRRTSVGTIARGIVDRVYADAAAGAEARFALFSGPDTDEAPDTSSDLSFDYRGARRVLEYDVQPIVFASFSFAVGLDLTGIPDFLRFDADYATDRVWSSGGSIERSTDVLGELELRGAASDAVRLALGIVGVQGDVVIARFDQGTVDVVDTATGTVEARVPLRFEATEIGAGFDILWAMPQARVRSFADQLEVGFRYLDYSIPRILYGLEDTDGDPDRDRYVYYAETPVQRVHSRYYLGEVRFRRGVHVGGRPGVLLRHRPRPWRRPARRRHRGAGRRRRPDDGRPRRRATRLGAGAHTPGRSGSRRPDRLVRRGDRLLDERPDVSVVR